YHLAKVSDLKAVASNLVYGGPPECPNRISCLKGLETVYGIHFKDFKSLDPGGPLTVAALKSNGVQVADLFTTDASILVNGFVVLTQDKPIVGAENVVPIAKLEEENRKDIARLIKALLAEGGMVGGERVLARIVEQHPEHAGAWMEADSHFSSGDPDSPFVHIGLHLVVERGVITRDHE